jgi:hypothetical protein
MFFLGLIIGIVVGVVLAVVAAGALLKIPPIFN